MQDFKEFKCPPSTHLLAGIAARAANALKPPSKRGNHFCFNSPTPLNCSAALFTASSSTPTGPRSGKAKKQKSSVRNIFSIFFRTSSYLLIFRQAKNSRISKEIIDNSDEETLPPIPESPLPEESSTTSKDVEIIDMSGDTTVN